jgi:hypothetical protein
MESKEFFSLFPKFRFEEKIEKPLELNLHANSVVSMNALNTVIASAIEKSKLGEAGFVKHDIFSSPTFEEKISYDYNMPPIFDDYGDENNYSAPTTIVHVGSINSFMHVAHDRDALCDSYIVNSIHDATESYYGRGKHGLIDLNNIEFPLFLLEFLKLYLFCLPMLFALRFHDLSLYKTIFIGSGLDLNVFHICFLMLSLASSYFMVPLP